MLTDWREVALPDLLAAHRLDGIPERPFPNDGWSGAKLTVLERDRQRFIVKRTSLAMDWIARATDDKTLREGWIAANRPHFFGPVGVPYLGAAADGESAALLMPDLSAELIAWERPAHELGIDSATFRRVLDSIALVHLQPWCDGEAENGFPWCGLRRRILLLNRRSAEGYRLEGLAVGDRFVAGWDAFDRVAPPAARTLVQQLTDDPGPLLDALARLPQVLLHGDLKLANVALVDPDGIALIDWQMAMTGPVAVELGWFLVSNVATLPVDPDVVLERYRDSVVARSLVRDSPFHGVDERVLGDWPTQVDLTWIVGLLLRGWRKGLDAESGTPTGWGASGSADLAWWCGRAVEAAGRRL